MIQKYPALNMRSGYDPPCPPVAAGAALTVWGTPGGSLVRTVAPSARPRRRAVRNPRGLAGAAALFFALALGVSAVSAQQAAVCSNTPAAGQRIKCTEGTDSTDDIDILATAVDVDTTAIQAHGIEGVHKGDGDINIETSVTVGPAPDSTITPTTVDTTGAFANGIHAIHRGDGNIAIKTVAGEFTAKGTGISALHHGDGSIDIQIEKGSVTSTSSRNSTGVWAEQYGDGTNTGDITITTSSVTVETEGTRSAGVHADLGDSGKVDVDIKGGSITTTGGQSSGLFLLHHHTGDLELDVTEGATITTSGQLSDGLDLHHRGFANSIGDVNVNVRNSTITTKNLTSHPIRARNTGTGDVNIYVENVTFETESMARDETERDTLSIGITGEGAGTGDVNIDVRNSEITTRGFNSYGIRGIVGATDVDDTRTDVDRSGDIHIEVRGGSVRTHRAGSHGILAQHSTGSGELRIDVYEGAVVHASGNNASGLQMGRVSSGNAERAAEEDAGDGYRKQIVTVNGAVTGGGGEAAGVFLAGGGKLTIGPKGTIRAASGIAVLATGDTPVDGGDPTKPKLLVNMNLDGRRVERVIGDDWIINDGGETTIVVNDEKLHDGATGVVADAVAANGAWDVRIKSRGVKVENRSDPANWTVAERAAGVVADRDFSSADFCESAKGANVCVDPGVTDPPSPPVVPPQPPVTPPEPEPEPVPDPLVFMEEFAPRAALYETLPNFLNRLRLSTRAAKYHLTTDPGVWSRLSRTDVSVRPEHSTVGAIYDFDLLAAEVGISVYLWKDLLASFSVRRLRASASVSSPTGGGDITARGVGPSLALRWQEARGYYVAGYVSLTAYDVDLHSDRRGRLKQGVNGQGRTLGIEAGRRFDLRETLTLTPHAWMTGTRLSVDGFTDAVNARVSVAGTDFLAAGLGLVAESTHAWAGGMLSLQGSLDVQQVLSGTRTAVGVSGERLASETERGSLLLGVGGIYRRDRFSARVDTFATTALGSSAVEYTGILKFDVHF